jgi:hypothetical protein
MLFPMTKYETATEQATVTSIRGMTQANNLDDMDLNFMQTLPFFHTNRAASNAAAQSSVPFGRRGRFHFIRLIKISHNRYICQCVLPMCLRLPHKNPGKCRKRFYNGESYTMEREGETVSAIVVFGRAAAKAGVADKDTAYSEFIEYFEDGTPSGVFFENAYASRVDEDVNGFYADRHRRKELIRRGIAGYSEFGLTTMHTVSDAPEESQTEYIDQYFELEELGELPVRIVLHPTLNPPWHLCPQTGFGTDMVRVGGLKIFLDGSLGVRSAALIEAYSDAPNEKGVFNFTEEELGTQIRRAYDAGLEVLIHAIGDAAMERVLNAAETVYPLSDEKDPVARLLSAGKKRLRIVHAMLVREDHIERLKRLPVILDVRPGFIDDDAEFAEKRLGTEGYDHPRKIRRLYRSRQGHFQDTPARNRGHQNSQDRGRRQGNLFGSCRFRAFEFGSVQI